MVRRPISDCLGLVRVINWSKADFMSFDGNYGHDFKVEIKTGSKHWAEHESMSRFPGFVDALAAALPDFNIKHHLIEERRASHGWYVVSPISSEDARSQIPADWLRGEKDLDRHYRDWDKKPERRCWVSSWVKDDD